MIFLAPKNVINVKYQDVFEGVLIVRKLFLKWALPIVEVGKSAEKVREKENRY